MIDPKGEKTWFETTFFQLPDIAQRQMGAIVGSLIADAAVNGMDLSDLVMKENEIVNFDEHERRFEQFASNNNNKNSNSRECPRLFSQDLIRTLNRSIALKVSRNTQNGKNSDSYHKEQAAVSLYRTWSPASVASIKVLQSIEASKSVDSSEWTESIHGGLGQVLAPPPQSTSALNSRSSPQHPMMPKEIIDSMTPANYSLFPLLSSIPIIALYPWARDSDVHMNSKTVFESIANHSEKLPFRVCPDLTISASIQQQQDENSNQQQEQEPLIAAAASEQAMQYYLAGSSTLLRYLQSNPDPSKNTLLRLRGDRYGFDRLPQIHEEETGRFGNLVFNLHEKQQQQQQQQVIPLTSVMTSAWNILRNDFYEVPSPKQFEKVIKRCVYETACVHRVRNPTHLAAFVGACVGAKYGVRNLPVDWMSECDRRSQGVLTQVVSTVVPMTQWVWNPPQ